VVALQGEAVTETLAVRARCTPGGVYHHIVFVLDGSVAQSTSVRRWTHQTVAEVVDGLKLEESPVIRVGVVIFGNRPAVSCNVTNDAQRVMRCADEVLEEPDNPGDAEDLGLRETLQVLRRARRLVTGPNDEAREIIVLISDARSVDTCRNAQREARSARSDGMLLLSVCSSRDCDRTCMRSLATSPRYFFEWPVRPGDIVSLFLMGGGVRYIAIKRLTVTGALPATTEYVPDSADPSPTAVSPDGRTITWAFNYVPKGGVTVTLRLIPGEPGHRPAGLAASGELLDNQNLRRDIAFDSPWVLTLGP
jgi:hypothetical protein